MRKVYTYFTPVAHSDSRFNIEEQTRLLMLWRENWSFHGFDPVVLNEYIASRHPLYDKFAERVEKLPSVNVPEYERACYLRYLAVAEMGGGIMCDYDVFCYDREFISKRGVPPSLMDCFQKHVPSLMYGDKRAYHRIIEAIMAYKVSIKDIVESGLPHVSDMYIFLREPNMPYNKVRYIVKNYGEEKWEKAPVVHYSTGAMNKHQTRSQTIKKLRNWE